jgi:uncharacterized membrane protein
VTFAYAIYLFVLTLLRFYNFQSEAIDVSYYRVALDQFSRFQMARIWDDPTRFVWGDHFEPILLFLGPVYWLIKSPYVLVVSQVLLVLAGVIPLYFVAKEKLKFFYLSLALVWAYLLFGGLQFGYMYGFHPILFAPFFLFWTYYFFVKENWKMYFIFLFLALFVKEEIAFTMIFFGVYTLLFKKNLKVGFATIIISILWAFLCFQIIFPYFNPQTGFGHWGQYAGANLKTLITPSYKIETFLVSYGAFSFLPLLFPPAFLITIPAILEKLLSNNLAGLNGFHYSAVIAAVVLIAGIESLSVILRIKKIGVAARPIFWTITIFTTALFFRFMYGYKPFYPPSQHADLINKTISAIPKDASISAQYQIASRISRSYGQILPAPRFPENADYVIIDTKMPLVLTTKDMMEKYMVEGLIDSKKYKLIIQQDEIMVWRRL